MNEEYKFLHTCKATTGSANLKSISDQNSQALSQRDITLVCIRRDHLCKPKTHFLPLLCLHAICLVDLFFISLLVKSEIPRLSLKGSLLCLIQFAKIHTAISPQQEQSIVPPTPKKNFMTCLHTKKNSLETVNVNMLKRTYIYISSNHFHAALLSEQH